jgi:hypothetical protein
MTRGEGIKKVSELFEIYRKKLRAPQQVVIEAFQEVVDDVCDFTIDKATVFYTPSSKTIILSGSGVVKSEVLLQKEEILLHLKGRLGEQSAPKNII